MGKEKTLRQYFAEHPYQESGFGTKNEYFSHIAKEIGLKFAYIKKKYFAIARSKAFNTTENFGDIKYTKEMGSEKGTITGTAKVKQGTDEKIILGNFLRAARVDMNEFEVEKYRIGGWDTTISGKRSSTGNDIQYLNTTISIWLRRKKKDFIKDGFDLFLEKIPSFAYPQIPPKYTGRSGYALELGMVDAHFGKLAWEAETGRRSYDLKIAESFYSMAVNRIMDWTSGYSFEKIYYVVGQDLMHIDNITGHTTNGTHDMDVDGRLPKIVDAALSIIIKSIYQCRSVAPVEVIWIPGNHDFATSYMICKMIDEHFRKDKHVTVDLGKTARKIKVWGDLLVGFTHRIVGREASWVNELAHAYPKEWGESKFREWHYGDQHKKKGTKMFPFITNGGVNLRQLTALTEIDRWHYENCFTDALQGGEAFVWSKDEGVIANFTKWI